MTDWKRLIPSKDVRELIKREGHSFTDFEIATLIFNGIQDYEEKRTDLKKLADSTKDLSKELEPENFCITMLR